MMVKLQTALNFVATVVVLLQHAAFTRSMALKLNLKTNNDLDLDDPFPSQRPVRTATGSSESEPAFVEGVEAWYEGIECPISYEPVPREDAVYLANDTKNPKPIFHRETLEKWLKGKTHADHPFTRMPYTHEDILPATNEATNERKLKKMDMENHVQVVLVQTPEETAVSGPVPNGVQRSVFRMTPLRRRLLWVFWEFLAIGVTIFAIWFAVITIAQENAASSEDSVVMYNKSSRDGHHLYHTYDAPGAGGKWGTGRIWYNEDGVDVTDEVPHPGYIPVQHRNF